MRKGEEEEEKKSKEKKKTEREWEKRRSSPHKTLFNMNYRPRW